MVLLNAVIQNNVICRIKFYKGDMYVCMYVCTCMYVCMTMYVCMYVCM